MNDIITPITDLFPMDQYDLESVIQKEGMLQINFIGKRYRILVDYEYLYIIYRSSDEGDRLKSLYYYLEDKEKEYFTKNLMYAVKESDFINWMVEEKFGFYSKETIFTTCMLHLRI